MSNRKLVALQDISFNELEKALEKKVFEPLKPGKYVGKIKDVKLQPSYDGLGTELKVTLVLLGGKGIKNRHVFQNLMIEHDQQDVSKEEGGKRERVGLNKKFLHNLMKFSEMGIGEIRDYSDLVGQIYTVDLSIFNNQNSVKGVYAFDEKYLDPDSSQDSSSL